MRRMGPVRRPLRLAAKLRPPRHHVRHGWAGSSLKPTTFTPASATLWSFSTELPLTPIQTLPGRLLNREPLTIPSVHQSSPDAHK